MYEVYVQFPSYVLASCGNKTTQACQGKVAMCLWRLDA